jgi:hypothetical protein
MERLWECTATQKPLIAIAYKHRRLVMPIIKSLGMFEDISTTRIGQLSSHVIQKLAGKFILLERFALPAPGILPFEEIIFRVLAGTLFASARNQFFQQMVIPLAGDAGHWLKKALTEVRCYNKMAAFKGSRTTPPELLSFSRRVSSLRALFIAILRRQFRAPLFDAALFRNRLSFVIGPDGFWPS